jgi:hypothetical protein
MQELAKEFPEKYGFFQGNAFDNLAALPEGYIESQRETLTPMEFMIEIENKRLDRIPNGFYPSFNEEVHLNWNTYKYVEDFEGRAYTKGFTDIESRKKLELSFDFNSDFTSVIVCQTFEIDGRTEFRVLDCLWEKPGVKNINLVDALVESFCTKYAGHLQRRVDIYGDRNGNNRNAGNDLTFYQMIQKKLREFRWIPALKSTGLDGRHLERYRVINHLLSETDTRLPVIRLNENTCRPLAIALMAAPISPDFKKVKDSEKSTSIPQENATHLTDCFDDIIMPKFGGLVGRTLGASTII